MNEQDIHKPSITFARIKNHRNCPRFVAPALNPIKDSWKEAKALYPVLKGIKQHLYEGLFDIQGDLIQEIICTERDGFILPERLGLVVAIFNEDKKLAPITRRHVKLSTLPGERKGNLVWNPNYGTNKQPYLKVWSIEWTKSFRKKIAHAFQHTPNTFKVVSSRFKKANSSKK